MRAGWLASESICTLAYSKVVRDLVPGAVHTQTPVECEHGRVKAQWQPMRRMKRAAALALGDVPLMLEKGAA